MAANACERDTWKLSFNHKQLQNTIKDKLKERSIKTDKLRLNRRTKDLQDGDFSVPKGCVDVDREIVEETAQEIMDIANDEKAFLSVKKIDSTKFYCFAIYLERTVVMKNVLPNIWQLFHFDQKIFIDKPKSKCVLIKSLGEPHKQSCEKKSIVLEQIRTACVIGHVYSLLKASGYSVRIIEQTWLNSTQVKQRISHIPQEVFVKPESYIHPSLEHKSLASNPFVMPTCNSQKTNRTSADTEHLQDSNTCVSLDLQKMMSNSSLLPSARHGYDPNLKSAMLYEEAEMTQTCADINAVCHCLEKDRSIGSVIHVHPNSLSFALQKVNLGLCAVTENKICQVHLPHGPVIIKDKKYTEVNLAEVYTRSRYEQMKEAAVLRYGSQVQDEGWEMTINTLADACMKFEMLSNVVTSPLKIEVKRDMDPNAFENRTGIFVMYNCARIAMLLKNFEQSVKEGVYPLLPDIGEIDFSHLREEDEWSLFFLYIYPFPDLLNDCMEDVFPETGITTKIHTHKICIFLVNLTHTLSSYYCRTHILGENKPHLLPVMYARLYLMKITHHILVHCLSLIGITALNQL